MLFYFSPFYFIFEKISEKTIGQSVDSLQNSGEGEKVGHYICQDKIGRRIFMTYFLGDLPKEKKWSRRPVFPHRGNLTDHRRQKQNNFLYLDWKKRVP